MVYGFSSFFAIWQLLINLFGLFLIIPSVAITVRRYHDSNKSGWFILLFLIPLLGWIISIILCVLPGDAGNNKYGEPAQDCKS